MLIYIGRDEEDASHKSSLPITRFQPIGAFIQPLKTVSKTLLTKGWKAMIEGVCFELPINGLQQALRNGAVLEQNKRVRI